MSDLVLDRAEFGSAVRFASQALPRTAAVPTLTGLRIRGSDTIVVSAFDYDVYAAASFAADRRDVDLLLPGRQLAAYLAGMTGPTLRLGIDNRTVSLACGAAKLTLGRLTVEDYPDPPATPPEICEVDLEPFLSACAAVRAPVDPNNALSELRGLLLTLGDPMRVVGVHQQRLTERDLPGAGDALRITLPLPLVDAAKGLTGRAVLSADETWLNLATPTRQVASRLIQAQMPRDYRNLIEGHKATHTVTVVRQDLIDALRWVITGDIGKDVTAGHLTIEIEPNELVITLAGAEGLGATTAVEAKVEGDPLLTKWKATNLLPGLAGTDADEVTLRFSGQMRPVLVTSDGDPAYRFVCAPINPRVGA